MAKKKPAGQHDPEPPVPRRGGKTVLPLQWASPEAQARAGEELIWNVERMRNRVVELHEKKKKSRARPSLPGKGQPLTEDELFFLKLIINEVVAYLRGKQDTLLGFRRVSGHPGDGH